MTPMVATLARINRALAEAHGTGDLLAVRELTEARDELRHLIEAGTDRLLRDVALMAAVTA